MMPERAALLRSRLTARLESGDDPGFFLSARAGNAYCLRSLRTSAAFLSIVLKGRKRIHHGAQWVDVVPGYAVLIAAESRIDVENIPDPSGGEYLAVLINLPPAVVQATRSLLGEALVDTAPDSEAPCHLLALDAITAELEHCLDVSTPSALPRFHHALAGLLLKLHERGITSFLRPSRPRLADTISALLASEPARDWRSIDIEDRLAMSGATLRRHLAAEQTTLRKILAETRLGQGLQLLQSTRLPVKAVAARAGYRSVSSFVRRFHERYGVEPSRVANARAGT